MSDATAKPVESAGKAAGQARVEPHAAAGRWPRWARRGPMEMAACIVIATGIFMMLQPFALLLYTYSFITTLTGVAMFAIVSKFPH